MTGPGQHEDHDHDGHEHVPGHLHPHDEHDHEDHDHKDGDHNHAAHPHEHHEHGPQCNHDHGDHHHEHGEHCDHDHGDHEEHDHEGHEHHDHEGHDHEHDHGEKEKFSLASAFKKVVDYVKNNKAETATIGGSAAILLASTALTIPLLPVTLALGLGAASIYMMKKTSDTALDHAMAFGKKLNLSPMKLGLILGALTTVPELAASLTALAQGQHQIAIGNVLGGNVAHTLLILGATAAIAGISAGRKGLSWAFNTKVMAKATGAFAGTMVLGNFLPQWVDKILPGYGPMADQILYPAAGLGMLYMGYDYLRKRLAKREEDNVQAKVAGEECATGACPFHDHHGEGDHHEHHDHDHHDNDHAHEDELDDGHNHGHSHEGKAGPSPDKMPAWFNAGWTAAGMAGLSGAAALLLHSAQQLGVDVGLSKEFIGAVTVGLGVSIPELYMSVNSALRKQGEFALGSVIGCNIFTTLLVGGAVSLAAGWTPEMMKIANSADVLNVAAFAGSAALATGTLMANKGSLKKWHGWTAVALYAAFAAGALALGHDTPTVKPDVTPAPIIQKAPAPAVMTPKVAYFENYAPETPVLPALDAITVPEERRALPPVPTIAPL